MVRLRQPYLPLRRFEILESRWLLAATVQCDVDVDALAEADVALIAELRIDATESTFGADCQLGVDEPRPDEPENGSDNEDSTSRDTPSTEDRVDPANDDTGREDAASAVDAFFVVNELNIGGEGEFVPFAGDRSSARIASQLGGMLNSIDADRSASLQQAITEESADTTVLPQNGVLPPDFLTRTSAANLQGIELWQRPVSAISISPAQPERTVVQFGVNVTHDPDSSRVMSAQGFDESSFDWRLHDRDESEPSPVKRSVLLPAEQTGRSAASGGIPLELPVDHPSRTGDLLGLWTPVEVRDTEAATNHSEIDEALLSYLRNVEWPLVPIVAGLAYAITRSIDRNEQTSEPNSSFNLYRRTAQRRRLASGR